MICATVSHALSLRPPALAFEDREVQQYVRRSRERFEAKPQQKFDYNYSQTSSSQNHYEFRKAARHRYALWFKLVRLKENTAVHGYAAPGDFPVYSEGNTP
jgi:hypothetical protein